MDTAHPQDNSHTHDVDVRYRNARIQMLLARMKEDLAQIKAEKRAMNTSALQAACARADQTEYDHRILEQEAQALQLAAEDIEMEDEEEESQSESDSDIEMAEELMESAQVIANKADRLTAENRDVAADHHSRPTRVGPKPSVRALTVICIYCDKRFPRNDECRRHLREGEYPERFPNMTKEERQRQATIDAP